MAFLYLLLLGASLGPGERTFLNLDELTCDFVMSCASKHGRTVILAPWYRRGQMPKINLYVYDFKQRKAWEVVDGRLRTSILVKIIPSQQGFILFDYYLGNLFYLDKEGSFVDNDRLDSFTGYDSDYKLKQAFPISDDSLLATASHERETDRYRLYVIDLQRKELVSLWQGTVQEAAPCYWTPNENDLLFISPNQGTIDLMSMNHFKKIKTLFDLEDSFKHKGRSVPVLTTPILNDGYLFLKRNIFRDARGKTLPKPKKELLAFSLKGYRRLTRSKKMIVGFTKDAWLLYDVSEGEFSVTAKSEAALSR